MPNSRKPLASVTEKKQASSPGGRGVASPKRAAASSAARGVPETIAPNQLRQIDIMLDRLERRNQVLAASADQLLRRVS